MADDTFQTYLNAVENSQLAGVSLLSRFQDRDLTGHFRSHTVGRSRDFK